MKFSLVVLFSVLITVVKGATFGDLNEIARKEIGESFIENVQSGFLCVISPSIENMFQQAWTPQRCSEADFLRLRREAYCPVAVLWKGLDSDCATHIWVGNDLELESNSSASRQEFLDVQKGLYRPFVPLDGKPKLAFLTKQVADSCQNCQRCTVVTNLIFQIEGFVVEKKTLHHSGRSQKLVETYRKMTVQMENVAPLILLSPREATEIVYLTALCRGKVRSLDEFNAAFVPKGEKFLVKLTAAECETEIGRMLYALVRKRGRIPKTKGDGTFRKAPLAAGR